MGKVRPTRVTGDEREELARSLAVKYDEGASIRELSATSGRSYGFVHRILTEPRRAAARTRRRHPRSERRGCLLVDCGHDRLDQHRT